MNVNDLLNKDLTFELIGNVLYVHSNNLKDFFRKNYIFNSLNPRIGFFYNFVDKTSGISDVLGHSINKNIYPVFKAFESILKEQENENKK